MKPSFVTKVSPSARSHLVTEAVYFTAIVIKGKIKKAIALGAGQVSRIRLMSAILFEFNDTCSP